MTAPAVAPTGPAWEATVAAEPQVIVHGDRIDVHMHVDRHDADLTHQRLAGPAQDLMRTHVPTGYELGPIVTATVHPTGLFATTLRVTFAGSLHRAEPRPDPRVPAVAEALWAEDGSSTPLDATPCRDRYHALAARLVAAADEAAR